MRNNRVPPLSESKLDPIDLGDIEKLNIAVSDALKNSNDIREDGSLLLASLGKYLVDNFQYKPDKKRVVLSDALKQAGFEVIEEDGVHRVYPPAMAIPIDEAIKEIRDIIRNDIYLSASLGLDDLYEIAESRGIPRNKTERIITDHYVSPTLDDDQLVVDPRIDPPRASHIFENEEDARRRLSRRSVVSEARLDHQKGVIHLSSKAPFNHEEIVRVRLFWEDLALSWKAVVNEQSKNIWYEAYGNSNGPTLVGKIHKGQNYVRVVIDAVQRPLVMDPNRTEITRCPVHVTSVIEDDSYPLSQSLVPNHVFIARRTDSHFELPQALSKVFERRASRHPQSNDNLTMIVQWVSPMLLSSQPTDNRGRGRPKKLGLKLNWLDKEASVSSEQRAPVTFSSLSPKPKIEIPPLLDEIQENTFSLISFSQGKSVEPNHVLPLTIAPSILTADFTELGTIIDTSIREGIDWIHLDVMDGNWVDNRTITFGPALIRSIRNRVGSDITLDCHLMINNAEETWEQYADAGVNIVIAHIEAVDDFPALITDLHDANVKAGCVLNPDTPAKEALQLLPDLDLVLVMSVIPGKGGQSFMPEVESKVRAFRAAIDAQVAAGGRATELMIDGGIKDHNVAMVADWGVNVAVVGSALINSEGTFRENLLKFSKPDISDAFLRRGTIDEILISPSGDDSLSEAVDPITTGGEIIESKSDQSRFKGVNYYLPGEEGYDD